MQLSMTMPFSMSSSPKSVADLTAVNRIIGPYQNSGPKGDAMIPQSLDFRREEYELQKDANGWVLKKFTYQHDGLQFAQDLGRDEDMAKAIARMKKLTAELKQGNMFETIGRIFMGRAVRQEDCNPGSENVAYLPAVRRALQMAPMTASAEQKLAMD